MLNAIHTELKSNWSWKQRDPKVPIIGEVTTTGWRSTQAYPSEIHVELLKNGLIPDPYRGFAEHEVQWVGEVEWLYKCTFDFKSGEGRHTQAELEFLGLDTVCDVYLNNEIILESSNMFQTHVVPILPTASINTLLLHFKSAKRLAKSLEEQHGKVRAGSTNLGDPSRVYVRKAQYDWRWDWGPELMTCGPFRPIILRRYTARIGNVWTHASVTDTNSTATRLKVDVDILGVAALPTFIKVALRDAKGTKVELDELSSKSRSVDWRFAPGQVQLWWPVGYGDQVLYRVVIELLGPNRDVIDSKTIRVGFRSVKLIQEELEEPDQYGTGTTFLFEINGIRMFMGGSNWIPADNFLTTLTPERYRAWLTLMRDGNQNMIRLWGGGIYEPDCFYDICDELGILVWQDFQFACGVYPAYEAFVASVRKEATDNVKRLRHHPSIALFCGNNEDYQMILQWGDVKLFPAIKIYEDVLPSIVEALCDPPIPYHRGSPYGGQGWDTADPTVGDVHQWNIWGGKELPYQEYDRMGGRFVSEFGMPSLPSMRTIEYWMDGAPAQEWHAQSALMAQHCRAGSFERRFAIAMNENFKVTEDLETYAFRTQVMQSESVGLAYHSWRRGWGGRGKQYTSGVLVWQLNDCWPVTSWAIVDYFMRPKPVYYTIKRHLDTFAIGLLRTVTKNRPTDRPRQFYDFGTSRAVGAKLDIWASNSTLKRRLVTLKLQFVDLKSNWAATEEHKVVLLPNQSSELISVTCPGAHATVVVGARLLDDRSGKVLARHVDWPQPYKYLALPDPRLKVTVTENKVELQVEKPAKCVFLSTKSNVTWSDNAIDLMPGEKRTVEANRLIDKNELRVAFLGREKAFSIP